MNDTTITTPKRARYRALGDLAYELDVTRAAIYIAADKGYIGGTIRVGKYRKIRNAAYAYHSEHGYGRGTPPYGTHQATGEIQTATADSAT